MESLGWVDSSTKGEFFWECVRMEWMLSKQAQTSTILSYVYLQSTFSYPLIASFWSNFRVAYSFPRILDIFEHSYLIWSGKFSAVSWIFCFLQSHFCVFVLGCKLSSMDHPLSPDLCMLAKSYLTLCSPMDCSPPGSSVHGAIL